jgi:hypothetical protein
MRFISDEMNTLLNEGLFVVSVLTNTTHPAFIEFSQRMPQIKFVAILITIGYIENYQ